MTDTIKPPMLLLVLALAGCSSMTQPEDIALAEEMCSKRGGFSSVARYERGKNIIIVCRDGAVIDVRLHEVKP
jgi:hypothetical protein